MKRKDQRSALVGVLLAEVFQTEESARVHPAREAKRLKGTAPGAAMLAVSHHAETALKTFEGLAKARGHERAKMGTLIGHLFSNLRQFGADFLISSEKSYRGTILGIRHGIGVVLLLEDAAVASGDQELADHCSRWLAERVKLAEGMESALAWFAENPDIAMTRVLPLMSLKGA